MVGTHDESCALQPMPPLLQSKLDGKQLPIPNVIIPLCRGKMTREKSEAYHSFAERVQPPPQNQRRPPPPQTADSDLAGTGWELRRQFLKVSECSLGRLIPLKRNLRRC